MSCRVAVRSGDIDIRTCYRDWMVYHSRADLKEETDI